MRKQLEDLLSAEAEARDLVAHARAEAEEVRRAAADEADTYHAKRRAQTHDHERELLEATLRKEEEEKKRIGTAADNEIAALRRRFDERRSALAAAMVRAILPTD